MESLGAKEKAAIGIWRNGRKLNLASEPKRHRRDG